MRGRNTGHAGHQEPPARPLVSALTLLLTLMGLAGVGAYLAAGAGVL